MNFGKIPPQTASNKAEEICMLSLRNSFDANFKYFLHITPMHTTVIGAQRGARVR